MWAKSTGPLNSLNLIEIYIVLCGKVAKRNLSRTIAWLIRRVCLIQFPKAAEAAESTFYFDYCLTGADSIDEAIELHHQLLNLFAKGAFLLRKWS